ncbi:MAG: RNA polymerase sigma factor [Planctomycetes bacterium]|nr:RNA polymerase sigma factor [Planctomycetota bacterium]
MSDATDKPDPNAPKPDFALPAGFRSNETEELVRRAQAGDAQALNDLFARYHSIMLEVARRKLGAKLRRKEEPDDLAQTTFREATRDFKNYEYRGEDSLLRWLIQILQNKIRDKAEFYSASKRDASHEVALEGPIDPERDTPTTIEPPSHDLSVTRQVQRDESFELLRQAVEQLSPEHRQAITLVFFQGMQLRDAGQVMGGKTEDAVRMMLRRAEGKLNEVLKRKLGKDPES